MSLDVCKEFFMTSEENALWYHTRKGSGNVAYLPLNVCTKAYSFPYFAELNRQTEAGQCKMVL